MRRRRRTGSTSKVSQTFAKLVDNRLWVYTPKQRQQTRLFRLGFSWMGYGCWEAVGRKCNRMRLQWHDLLRRFLEGLVRYSGPFEASIAIAPCLLSSSRCAFTRAFGRGIAFSSGS
jgi:hypothetical protein